MWALLQTGNELGDRETLVLVEGDCKVKLQWQGICHCHSRWRVEFAFSSWTLLDPTDLLEKQLFAPSLDEESQEDSKEDCVPLTTVTLKRGLFDESSDEESESPRKKLMLLC